VERWKKHRRKGEKKRREGRSLSGMKRPKGGSSGDQKTRTAPEPGEEPSKKEAGKSPANMETDIKKEQKSPTKTRKPTESLLEKGNQSGTGGGPMGDEHHWKKRPLQKGAQGQPACGKVADWTGLREKGKQHTKREHIQKSLRGEKTIRHQKLLRGAGTNCVSERQKRKVWQNPSRGEKKKERA